MAETIHKIITYLAIALGLVHIGFAGAARRFDLNVLWFIGSGLAIVFAGFLNLALLRMPSPKDSLVRLLCVAADLILAILFATAFFTVLSEPQAAFGSLIFGACAIFSILQKS